MLGVRVISVGVVACLIAAITVTVVRSGAPSGTAEPLRTEQVAYTVSQMTTHDPHGGPAHAVVPMASIGPIDTSRIALSPRGDPDF